MKIPGLFKLLNLIFPLVILNISAFGQTSILRPDVRKDSTWISQSLVTANKQDTIHKDSSGIVPPAWTNGKVIYCADGSLKATQLTAGANIFTTSVQYISHNKTFEQRLDYTDLSNYTLNKVYRLPDKKPSYLFLLSKIENQPDYTHDWVKNFLKTPGILNDKDFNHIKRLSYTAVVLRLQKDSLVEISFPDDTPDNDNAETVNVPYADTCSFGFTSYIKQTGKFPRPFLTYDTLAHTLRFLNTYWKDDTGDTDCADPYLNIEAGTYEYRDTAFIQTRDTLYYYPLLQSLNKTVKRRNYKVGQYLVKARAIEGYEEEYGGAVIPTLTIQYRIRAQMITDFNNSEWNSINLEPNYHLQQNGSFILRSDDEIQGYSPGMCGAASSSDSYFWFVDNKSSKKLFSYSSGSCSVGVSYAFTQRGEKVSGSLYLTDPSVQDDYELGNFYWKSNSTYVFVVNDNNSTNLSRNFYLHFNVSDKNTPVTFKVGKLYRRRKRKK